MKIRTSTHRESYKSDSYRESGPSVPWRVRLEMLAGIASLGLVFASLFMCWHWACQSDLFRVSRVHITGCRHLTQEEILRLSKVTAQDNLLSLNLKSIAGAIETDPWVRSVEVRRRLPDQLIIKVQERTPVALLRSGKMYLVGDRGKIIEEVPKRKAFSFPIITGIGPGAIKDLKQGKSQSIQRALNLISMASKGTRTLGVNNINRIDMTRGGTMVVYTVDRKVPFCFGKGDEKLGVQFHKAEKILYQLYRSGMYKRVNRVDLNYARGCAWASLSR
ncbi:MAG: FtsQ-type POTRA domain-containing protein [Nitrospiraceae bacterium]|nr:FtsQ-type POTRA domain-containing protein [Nitrospiraceae bacterium]